MSLCCGKERSTNFCPDCGAAVNAPPLHSLLAHLRSAADKAKSELEDFKKHHPVDERDKRYLAGKISRKQNIYNKWSSWRDAVAEVIKSREGGT